MDILRSEEMLIQFTSAQFHGSAYCKQRVGPVGDKEFCACVKRISQVSRYFCLWTYVLHDTRHYSLTQLEQKFGTCKVSREWWLQELNAVVSRVMKLGTDVITQDRSWCGFLGVGFPVCYCAMPISFTYFLNPIMADYCQTVATSCISALSL